MPNASASPPGQCISANPATKFWPWQYPTPCLTGDTSGRVSEGGRSQGGGRLATHRVYHRVAHKHIVQRQVRAVQVLQLRPAAGPLLGAKGGVQRERAGRRSGVTRDTATAVAKGGPRAPEHIPENREARTVRDPLFQRLCGAT